MLKLASVELSSEPSLPWLNGEGESLLDMVGRFEVKRDESCKHDPSKLRRVSGCGSLGTLSIGDETRGLPLYRCECGEEGPLAYLESLV